MPTVLAVLLLCLCFAGAPLHSQETDDVFLSLTRTGESLNTMPSNVAVINSTKIEGSGAKNLSQLLAHETGLLASQTGTLGQLSSLSIRGSSTQQVLVLMDGRRMNDLGNGMVDLSSIPVDNIERIEIIRGGAAAIYGTSAFGGMIHIITKKPAEEQEPAATANLHFGDFNTQHYALNVAAASGATSGILTASKSSSNGWRDNSAYDNYNVFTRLGYAAGTYGTFDLSGSFFRSSCGTPGKAVIAPFTTVTPDLYDGRVELAASSPQANQKDARDYLRLEHTASWGRSAIKSSVYHSNEKRNYQDPVNSWGALDNEFKAQTFGAEVQFTAPYGITAGTEWWQERFAETNLLTTTVVSDHCRTTTAGYLQEELRSGCFTVIPGMRYDNNSIFGGVFSPRVTAVCRISGAVSVSANSGKIWRAPSFDDLYSPLGGNPDLKPEEGLSSDIGVKYSRNSMTGSVTCFVTDSDNFILWAPIDPSDPLSFWIPKNIERSRQSGAECSVSQKISSSLSHALNYTYMTISGTDNQNLVMYRPEHKARYGISYTAPTNTMITLSTDYVSAQKSEDAATDLPSYMTVGAEVTQRLADTKLWLKADNITDKKYQTRLGYPLPGITLSGGITIKFWS